MIINLIHRPVAGEKKEIFILQQEMAHELGLKVTLLLQYELLFEADIVDAVKQYHQEHGDEIGIWFSDIASDKMNEIISCKEPFLWLYSRENKRKIISTVTAKFKEVFGFDPKVAGAYHVDSYSMGLFKELCPSIEISIAGCFEEGVKVFHGCNNSWYLFNEGMPWNPWYPAVENTLRPAENEEEWTGIVAIPHLARDLALSFEGRNDFFASHPANVQRAMANEGEAAPYVFNLLDLYRLQEKYNQGFSYTNVFVGPGWLKGNPNVQDSDEITQKLYYEYLKYFVELRSQGRLQDMYMSEFAQWYKENIPIGTPQVYLAKEILYGSRKHYFWYSNSNMRITIDACQGGAIGDLRPLVAKQPRCTGTDMPNREIGSNPYLIHSQYRSGNSYHYADGARTTLLVKHNDVTLDLANYQSRIESIETEPDHAVKVELSPVEIEFPDGLKASIATTYTIEKDGRILVGRRILDISDTKAVLEITEYFKGCYGVIEYPEKMDDVILSVKGKEEASIKFSYDSRRINTIEPQYTSAKIPQIGTEVYMEPITEEFFCGAAEEGYLFNPYYTLSLTGKISKEKEAIMCLRLIASK